jgi:hypothetical protein
LSTPSTWSSISASSTATTLASALLVRAPPPHHAARARLTRPLWAYRWVVRPLSLSLSVSSPWWAGGVGYPEGHTEATSLDDDIRHLKTKVDAGADFIVTQLFYDTDLFLAWVSRCRAEGISAPIIPGIMPIHTYAGWKRMTTLCKTSIPPHMAEALEACQHDDAAVKDYGVQYCIDMIRKMLAAGIRGTAPPCRARTATCG